MVLEMIGKVYYKKMNIIKFTVLARPFLTEAQIRGAILQLRQECRN